MFDFMIDKSFAALWLNTIKWIISYLSTQWEDEKCDFLFANQIFFEGATIIYTANANVGHPLFSEGAIVIP